ncbi:hypothetical protein EMCRGX_G031422 [Ephydatia muelleri]
MDQLVHLVLMLLVGDACALSFQRASTDLCNSLALVARKICTTYVDPQGLAALTANRLIALDKCPGVRPIGVGEIVRRIISKAVLFVIKSDVLEAACTLQLCAGHEAGTCEAAMHLMCRIFHDATTEAVLLVDANNAFNSLKHLGKTWFIAKPQHERDAKELFSGTGIGITSEGKQHLGAALGSRSFLESYISEKVKVWTSTILNLSFIAKTQPHAVYCAFVHGVSGLWTSFLCTIPDISSLLQPLEDTIRLHFIPSITGRDSISDIPFGSSSTPWWSCPT